MTTTHGWTLGAMQYPPARGVTDTYPLTPMQQGMLFETVAQDRPWANLQQVVCRMDDAIDLPALRNAWRLAQQNHGVLRSSFRWQQLSTPVLDVHTRVPIPFVVHDWTSLEPVQQEEALEQWCQQDRAEGIALSEAPCMRLTFMRLADRQAVLVWTFHHALLDGRGFTLVLEEVFDTYDELRRGKQPQRAPVAQFAEHAAAVAARDVDAEREFFGDLLGGFSEPTKLPIATEPSTAGPHQEVVLHLEATAVRKLEALAHVADATLYTCVLAAWALLLAGYARSNDVVFGSTRSGRHTIAGAENVPGCFINTLPTRVRVDPEESVGAMLRSIREGQLDVRPFEQASLVDTQRCSNVPASTALLTTNVVFEQHLMDTRLRSKGGAWEHRSFEVIEEGGFDLSLAAYLDDDLRLCLEFDPSVYDRESVEAMVGHLHQLLLELSEAQAASTVKSLQMLTEPERSALLDPADRVPATETYLEAFERSVVRSPEALAVGTMVGPSLTYASLDGDANQLAHLLRSLGAGPDSRVVIFAPRSLEFVTSVLAVGKAQAAYVPLDPSYPAEVVAQMLTDCGATIVLTHSDVVDDLPPTAATVIVADTDPRIAAEPTGAPPRNELRLSHMAYVIYTSGSTGTPKGVMVSHAALASHSHAFVEATELVAEDRVLHFASLSFDVSIEQLIPTLVAGACVVLRSDEMAESVTSFLAEVDRQNITVLNLPTTFWCEVVRYMGRTRSTLARSVRVVVVGGEEVPAAVYNAWTRLVPDVRWLNGYGPTECTITCTIHDPKGRTLGATANSVPIGRPTANADAYVRNPRGQLVPVGVPGELWVGGPCVATGYLGAAKQTAAAFHSDPFSDSSEARLYRTGDLVRWLRSGELEFLGRIDRQIKLRGFRIEPRQIEAVAERHHGVSTAVLAVRDSGSGEPALLLWVTPSGLAEFDAGSLRAHLLAHLPSHMQPTTTLVVDTLPTTAGGKIDVAALPSPGAGSGPAEEADVEARDELDHQIVSLMARVLGIDAVKLEASFFDLGGNSLLAVRLLDELEEATGARITLPTLHSAPSAWELADVVRSADHTQQYEYLVPIQPTGTKPPLFGVHVLGENGSFFRPLAERLGPDQPVYGLGVGLVTADNSDSPTGVEEIASAYALEVQGCAPEGPIILAAVSLGSVVAIELAQQLLAAGRDVRLVALFDARGPGLHTAVPARERVAIHMRRMRQEGLGYVGSQVGVRWTSLTERAGLLRARALEALGREVPAKLKITRFINDNSTAQQSYDMLPYSGAVAIFCADEEVFDDPQFRQNGMGWSDVAVGTFHILEVPGAHLTILAEPHVETLANKLAPLL